jgi:hypothetical protein
MYALHATPVRYFFKQYVNKQNNMNDHEPIMPIKKASAVSTFNSFSKARKLVLAALLLHLISLFFTYQDSDVKNTQTIMWNTGDFVKLGTEEPVQTGMQLKPFGAAVIIILIIFFLSKMAEDPFWRKYGYWITLALVIFFAMGGAVIRTTGGNISLISVGLLFVAAFNNRNNLMAAKKIIDK